MGARRIALLLGPLTLLACSSERSVEEVAANPCAFDVARENTVIAVQRIDGSVIQGDVSNVAELRVDRIATVVAQTRGGSVNHTVAGGCMAPIMTPFGPQMAVVPCAV